MKKTQQLSFSSHDRTINNSTKTKQKTEKLWRSHPVLHTSPNINEPPRCTPPPAPTFPSPIISSSNTIIMISLAQLKQSNGYGSVRNDDIFNLHLESGAGPWVSNPCLLQDTSHIYRLNLPKQWSKKKQKILEKDLFPTNCMVLPWFTYIEPSAKRGRLGTHT